MFRCTPALALLTVVLTACAGQSGPQASQETGSTAPLRPLVDAYAFPPPGYALRWSDDFDGTAVDTSKWNYRTDVKADSAQRPENVSVANGVASIALKRESYGEKSYTGGGLVSKARFRFGYFQARVKMHGGAGWHQSVWAQFGDGSTTFPQERRTEIDATEFDSNNVTQTHSGLIKWNADGTSRSQGCSTSGPYYSLGFDASAGYHVYGYEWTETQVKYYVDGALKCTLDYPPGDHPHDRLNLWLTAIGYTQGAGAIDNTKLPGTMEIGHAYFYEKDLYIDNGEPGYSEGGTWASSALQGFSQSNSRYSCESGATATWSPNVLASDSYQVFVYKVVDGASDTNSRLDITANGGTTTRYVNFASGTSGWVDLGTYTFQAGTGSAVKLTRGNGCARADMVKFVRQ